jgi:DNA-binding response OmpR family regulator
MNDSPKFKSELLAEKDMQSPHRKSILCVDDNNDTCEMLSVVFSEYEFVSAGNLQKARSLIESRDFDLYILDNWLPDGSGVDLCKKIRLLSLETPIVFISGVGYETDICEALSAGANKYLIKPCEPEMIEKVVKELIG